MLPLVPGAFHQVYEQECIYHDSDIWEELLHVSQGCVLPVDEERCEGGGSGQGDRLPALLGKTAHFRERGCSGIFLLHTQDSNHSRGGAVSKLLLGPPADGGVRILPGGAWLLQRLRHVCGHTVPVLLGGPRDQRWFCGPALLHGRLPEGHPQQEEQQTAQHRDTEVRERQTYQSRENQALRMYVGLMDE